MMITDFMAMCNRIAGLIEDALRVLRQINRRLTEIADLLKQIDSNTSLKPPKK